MSFNFNDSNVGGGGLPEDFDGVDPVGLALQLGQGAFWNIGEQLITLAGKNDAELNNCLSTNSRSMQQFQKQEKDCTKALGKLQKIIGSEMVKYNELVAKGKHIKTGIDEKKKNHEDTVKRISEVHTKLLDRVILDNTARALLDPTTSSKPIDFFKFMAPKDVLTTVRLSDPNSVLKTSYTKFSSLVRAMNRLGFYENIYIPGHFEKRDGEEATRAPFPTERRAFPVDDDGTKKWKKETVTDYKKYIMETCIGVSSSGATTKVTKVARASPSVSVSTDNKRKAPMSLIQVQMDLRKLTQDHILYIESCVEEGMLTGDVSTIDTIPNGVAMVEFLLYLEKDKAKKVVASVRTGKLDSTEIGGCERPLKRQRMEERDTSTPIASNTTDSLPNPSES